MAFSMLWIDVYYFLWAYTMRYNLPKETSDMIVGTLRGNIGGLKDYLIRDLTRNIEELKKESGSGNEEMAVISQ